MAKSEDIGKSVTIDKDQIKLTGVSAPIKAQRKKAIAQAGKIGEIVSENKSSYVIKFGKTTVIALKRWVMFAEFDATEMEKQTFEIPFDGPDGFKAYEGYHDPLNRWNGWYVPYFKKAVAKKILEDANIQFREDGDDIYAVYQEGEKEEQISRTTITVKGKPIEVYDMSNGWTWDLPEDMARGGQTKEKQQNDELNWEDFKKVAYEKTRSFFKKNHPAIEVWKNLSLRNKETNFVYRAEISPIYLGNTIKAVEIVYYHGQNPEAFGTMSYDSTDDSWSIHFPALGIVTEQSIKFGRGGPVPDDAEMQELLKKAGDSGSRSNYTERDKYLDEYTALKVKKIKENQPLFDRLFNNPDITVLVISSKNPLSSQLTRLTGDSWNVIDFDGDAGLGEIITHKATGRKFTAVNEFEAAQIRQGSNLSFAEGGETSNSDQPRIFQPIDRKRHPEIFETIIRGENLSNTDLDNVVKKMIAWAAKRKDAGNLDLAQITLDSIETYFEQQEDFYKSLDPKDYDYWKKDIRLAALKKFSNLTMDDLQYLPNVENPKKAIEYANDIVEANKKFEELNKKMADKKKEIEKNKKRLRSKNSKIHIDALNKRSDLDRDLDKLDTDERGKILGSIRDFDGYNLTRRANGELISIYELRMKATDDKWLENFIKEEMSGKPVKMAGGGKADGTASGNVLAGEFTLYELSDFLNKRFPDSFSISVVQKADEREKRLNDDIFSMRRPGKEHKNVAKDKFTLFDRPTYEVRSGSENLYVIFSIENTKSKEEFTVRWGYKESDTDQRYLSEFITMLHEAYSARNRGRLFVEGGTATGDASFKKNLGNDYQDIIGSEFEFNGKTHVVNNVESTGVIAKPKDAPNGPLKLILPIDEYNKITGKNISAPAPVVKTPEDYRQMDIIKKAEAVKFRGGQNGKQYIDKYIADGYNKIITLKRGAVNNYYLDNEKTNMQLLISGPLRQYATMVLAETKMAEGGISAGDDIRFKDSGKVLRAMDDEILVRDASGNNQVIPDTNVMGKFGKGGLPKRKPMLSESTEKLIELLKEKGYNPEFKKSDKENDLPERIIVTDKVFVEVKEHNVFRVYRENIGDTSVFNGTSYLPQILWDIEHAIGTTSILHYYAVAQERNLGYVFTGSDSRKYFGFLHASVLKGSNYGDLSGPRSVEQMAPIRKATKKDFDDYRVSVPPDFEELNGK